MNAAAGAVSVVGRARMLLLASSAVALLAACATATVLTPPAHSRAERQWIDNAGQFIGTLDSDLTLSAAGGANLATARRALHDESAIYTMLVAYELFGDCGPALANVGAPSARAGDVVQTLIAACGRLEHASALFQRAMTRHDPRPLLAAGKAALSALPLLSRASAELATLARGTGA